MNTRKFLLICSVAAISSFLFTPPAISLVPGKINNVIQGGHSGNWYDVTQPGHGLFVEVIDSNESPTGKKVLVAWFAFINGEQVWVLGLGNVVPIEGGFRAELDAWVYEGNDFPPFYDPGLTTQIPWGTLLLSFTGCDQAHLEWNSVLAEYGTGMLELRRLTSVADSTCIPDLGGEAKQDDHGDTWASGTYLSNIGRYTEKVAGKLEEGGDVDVFVFTLSSRETVTFFTGGPSDTDTMATLFKIITYDEVKILESNENATDSGFQFEVVLEAGTYSIHVSGNNGLETGPYIMYYRIKSG